MTRVSPTRTTRTVVARRILADPTSTALLLAAPSALELWPGVTAVADRDGRVVVEAAVAAHANATATVRALPPRRTPTSYLTRFEWEGPGLPSTTGELTLAYSSEVDGTLVTDATLVLHSTALGLGWLDRSALRDMAEGFLANLARAAELRSHAA